MFRYDFNALQSKLDDDQKQLSDLTNTQTAASSSLPGPSEPPTSYNAFGNAVRTIDVTCSYYQALLEKQQLIISRSKQMSSGLISMGNGVRAIHDLNRDREILERNSAKLLTNANIAIRAFNSSPFAQKPNLNQAVGQKRLQLNELFRSVHAAAPTVIAALVMSQQRAYTPHSAPPPSRMVSQQQVSQSGQSSSSSHPHVPTPEVSSTTDVQ